MTDSASCDNCNEPKFHVSAQLAKDYIGYGDIDYCPFCGEPLDEDRS